MNMQKWAIGLGLALASMLPQVRAEDVAPAPVPAALVLKSGARLAIVGDSITEQKQYSRFIETYLTVCTPQLDVRVCQFGWSGEGASGFLRRMDNDLRDFEPTVVTTCYGMNDGGYRAFTPAIGKGYEGPMKQIVDKLKKAGVTVVVGSPGAVDTKYFGKGVPEAATVYNEALGQLRNIARQVAAASGQPFADVHQPMMDAMAKAKAAFGDAYDVCGGDGLHPGPNGHLVMAYAFLKALGVDGNIGAIAVDMKGQATASDGHKILSAAGGKVEIESTRYPFCFSGDDKSPGGTRSILPFVPFNAELNRLTLTVKNLDKPAAKVTWGAVSKTFTREQLEKGINLAAEFPTGNPFAAAFAKVDGAVAAKQNFETFMIRSFIANFPGLLQPLGQDAEAMAAVEVLRKRLAARDDALAADVKKAMAPVTHTLVIEPAEPPAAPAAGQ